MVEWIISEGLTDYEEAVAVMEARADAIARGEADELIWLVEHPPLYTAGTSAKVEEAEEQHHVCQKCKSRFLRMIRSNPFLKLKDRYTEYCYDRAGRNMMEMW